MSEPLHQNKVESDLRRFRPRLIRGEDLSGVEAAQLLDALLDPEATDSQIASALIALRLKGETFEELAGLAEAMRERAVRITSRHACFIDTAGTGSSPGKTFHVSTAAAILIAGAGLGVANHRHSGARHPGWRREAGGLLVAEYLRPA